MNPQLLGMPVLLVALTVGFAGCSSTPKVDSAKATVTAPVAKPAAATTGNPADAEKAITDAKAAMAAAKKLNNEWRDTDDMMKLAEEAQGAGDYLKAVELANKARRQADNAVAQANSERVRLSSQYK
jgi:hypothetical protein